MELKDVILSTLAEMEEIPEVNSQKIVNTTMQKIVTNSSTASVKTTDETQGSVENELAYLNSIRERLLVLFEGFQSPNNANIEAKIDMTLNFLEYTLATIDERVQKLEKGKL